MKKVTQEDFFKVVGPLDAVISIEGVFPYKSVFKLRHGEKLGEIIGKRTEDCEEDEYYLND